MSNVRASSIAVFSKLSLGASSNSAREKAARQQKMNSQVDYWENKKESFKGKECGSLEAIKDRLEQLQACEDEIAAAKKAYNHEQMFHVLDEAREQGEKIAEEMKKHEPKTAEERQEELAEEALGTPGGNNPAGGSGNGRDTAGANDDGPDHGGHYRAGAGGCRRTGRAPSGETGDREGTGDRRKERRGSAPAGSGRPEIQAHQSLCVILLVRREKVTVNHLRIGICEDDPVQTTYLQQEIQRYYDRNGILAEIESFHSAEALLFRYPTELPFQCLLLDIGLKKMDGMDLARRIREYDRDISIIFITGDRDSVFDGYKVGAVRYLLKPYRRMDLEEALCCIRDTRREQGMEEYIGFRYQGEYRKLKKSDILLAEVQGHYLCVKTIQGEYTYKGSMKQLRQEWTDDCFCMANRSVLVNILNVERITRTECLLADGTVVPISRSCYQNLNQVFMRCFM